MILNSRYLPLVLTAAVVFSASAATLDNAPAKSTNVAKPATAAPTTDELVALERKANEVYIKGDGKLLESLLSDKLVMQKGGSRLSKTDVLRMISGVKCEVKEGWTLTGPQVLKIDNDAYVLTYKSNRKRGCPADFTAEKMRDPVRAATVWVRNGNAWQVAFHGENLIVGPKAAPADNKKEMSESNGAATNADAAGVPASAKAAADPITVMLMTAENFVWEAWMTHDANRSRDLTAKDIAFVDLFGTFFANKAATIRDWTSALCEVKSFTLTNGVGTSVSPTIGILTLTGTVVGTCGGQDISGQKVYANSVYVKDGSGWKWVFGFNSPS